MHRSTVRPVHGSNAFALRRDFIHFQQHSYGKSYSYLYTQVCFRYNTVSKFVRDLKLKYIHRFTGQVVCFLQFSIRFLTWWTPFSNSRNIHKRLRVTVPSMLKPSCLFLRYFQTNIWKILKKHFNPIILLLLFVSWWLENIHGDLHSLVIVHFYTPTCQNTTLNAQFVWMWGLFYCCIMYK